MFASAADVVRFPDCPHCPIRETASPPVCLRCAAPHLRMIEPPTCPTCGQHLDPEGACPNEALCRSPNRALSRVEALAALEGELERRLRALKYGRETSWALVLGRLLAIVLRRGPRLGGETPAAESAEELAEAPVGPGTGGGRGGARRGDRSREWAGQASERATPGGTPRACGRQPDLDGTARPPGPARRTPGRCRDHLVRARTPPAAGGPGPRQARPIQALGGYPGGRPGGRRPGARGRVRGASGRRPGRPPGGAGR